MSDHGGDDPSLTARLHARNGTAGLHRRRMADGGDVYSGPTAKRALRALGARAMTMDNTIFVDDSFDASKPEDAALYAHERHHQMESGGVADGHGPKDAEEVAARAIERMVLHRASRGEELGSIMRDVVSRGAASAEGGGGGGTSGPATQNNVEPMAAYQAMIGSGKSHAQVIRDLTQFVMETLGRMEEEDAYRRTDSDFL